MQDANARDPPGHGIGWRWPRVLLFDQPNAADDDTSQEAADAASVGYSDYRTIG